MKIIDAKVRLRTEVLMKPWTTDLKPYYRDYINLFKMKSRLSVIPLEEMLEMTKKSGIEKMLVHGISREENEHILKLSGQYPDIIPVTGVNVGDGIGAAMRDIADYSERGAAAIAITPYLMKLDANDRRLYPLYGLCEMKKRPVIVHGAVHFWREASMWHGQPNFFDEIAVDFPELKLIISHGGNGFGPSILAVAQRHPNVYLEFSALNPAYMAPEFLYAVNTYLNGKCMFGTDYPLTDFETMITRWKKVLRPDVHDKFFYQNIIEALSL